MAKWIAVYVVCIALTSCRCSQARRRTSTRPRREPLARETGPTSEELGDSGLLETCLHFSTIYERGRQYHQDTHAKNFEGPTLAYVTPWNPQGYELALLFRSKLSHVSPVWYQLRRNAQGHPDTSGFYLAGGHDVNQTWIRELRAGAGADGDPAAAAPRVVPRIMVELSNQDMMALIREPQAALDAIVSEVVAQAYDGVVLEVMVQWIMINGLSNAEFKKAALGFIKALAELLHAAGGLKDLVLTIPPVLPSAHNRPFVELAHIRELAPYVDGWSVMTYDYADGVHAAPNAPLPWLQKNIKLLFSEDGVDPNQYGSRLWLGLNFYGYDFDKAHRSSKAITSADYLKLLVRHKPEVVWDADVAEHHFEFSEPNATGSTDHVAFYPTAKSLQMRLELLQSHGLGAAIWELGQGLEHFFDLL